MADEPWKIMLCSRDFKMASDTLDALGSILTNAGGNQTKMIEQLKEMSGENIVNGLLSYMKINSDSIENGIKK